MSSLGVPKNLKETLAIHRGPKDGEIIVVGLTSPTGTDNTIIYSYNPWEKWKQFSKIPQLGYISRYFRAVVPLGYHRSGPNQDESSAMRNYG